MSEVERIKKLLQSSSSESRQEIFSWLRASHLIHPLEQEFGAPAEIILEAISRSNDLTKRGVRGIIAEASFKVEILDNLTGWTEKTSQGEHPYDFLITKGKFIASIQVKMQRMKYHRPMTAREALRRFSEDYYVVETQKTRGGLDTATGEDTRPYRFGEFDILAVSMHPSTGNWSNFLYTLTNWLIPRNENSNYLLKFQPVPHGPNEDWTDSMETCLMWLKAHRSKKVELKRIGGLIDNA